MLQIECLEELLKLCKAANIHTAVDTAGCVSYALFERILPCTDLVLFDIKCMDSAKHKRFTGVDNSLILDNLKALLLSRCPVWVRIPVVPGVNDSVDEMQEIRRFFEENGWPEKIELLPYHAMGEHKYGELGLATPDFSMPDEDTMKTLRAVFN